MPAGEQLVLPQGGDSHAGWLQMIQAESCSSEFRVKGKELPSGYDSQLQFAMENHHFIAR